MPKTPKDEDQLWAISYAVAASLLILGTTVKNGMGGTNHDFAGHIDTRAAAVADKAVDRLKGRLR